MSLLLNSLVFVPRNYERVNKGDKRTILEVRIVLKIFRKYSPLTTAKWVA
jgi:hypothetical protein